MSEPEVTNPVLATDKPPRPWRPMPVSLRIFLVTLALFAVGSVLRIGIPAYRQNVAIREVERAIRESNRQAHTCTGWTRKSIAELPTTEWRKRKAHNSIGWTLRGPKWWQDLVRRGSFECTQPFYDMCYVEFDHVQVTDVTLRQLGQLPELGWLSLNDTQVTDAALAHLKSLDNLSQLSLCNTQVTDAGLANLTGLTSLRGLNLDNTQITDAGLAHLKGLTFLLTLSLQETQVTDIGIAELQRALPGLEIRR